MTTADVDALRREALVDGSGTLRISGQVRETLLDGSGIIYGDVIVREVMVTFAESTADTTLRVSRVAREVLLFDPPPPLPPPTEPTPPAPNLLMEVGTIVLVEIDFWDGMQTRTLRLSSKGPVAYVSGGVIDAYKPRLDVPVQIGSRIVADQYGDAVRGAQNGGAVTFSLAQARLRQEGPQETDPEMWQWLLLHCKGREVRVYLAEQLGDVGP